MRCAIRAERILSRARLAARMIGRRSRIMMKIFAKVAFEEVGVLVGSVAAKILVLEGTVVSQEGDLNLSLLRVSGAGSAAKPERAIY